MQWLRSLWERRKLPAQHSREVASVLIVLAAEMGEPQEAQPEPHEKSESPEHHLFKKAETVRFFMAQAHRAAASREP